MVEVTELEAYCDGLLSAADFADYCPNGLQVEAERPVRRLISGVTASRALIDAAAADGADAILVHHGWFWRGESPRLTGMKGRRVRALLGAGMSLLAYHLPLDAHPELGNNRCLADRLGFLDARATAAGGGLVWRGRLAEPAPGALLAARLSEVLDHAVVQVAVKAAPVEQVAWCTGAAQGYIEEAAVLGVDAFISGEISEQTTHQARELGLDYLAAGHHATERYGVQALGDHLAERFGIEHRFIDVDNPA
jgi:dinuclear metal center YbgI/SA1388 family protein